MKEICIRKKCKECPEQEICFGCESHNYILIKSDTSMNTYKCSKCNDILRLYKNDMCCTCINKCKGKVKSEINKDKGTYKTCNSYNNGDKE